MKHWVLSVMAVAANVWGWREKDPKAGTDVDAMSELYLYDVIIQTETEVARIETKMNLN